MNATCVDFGEHDMVCDLAMFQWAPTLGGECYVNAVGVTLYGVNATGFNGHPPLGVNATCRRMVVGSSPTTGSVFQWAPTLGGECYLLLLAVCTTIDYIYLFQWAPTLGGECYAVYLLEAGITLYIVSGFNGHPPLGVNATV